MKAWPLRKQSCVIFWASDDARTAHIILSGGGRRGVSVDILSERGEKRGCVRTYITYIV